MNSTQVPFHVLSVLLHKHGDAWVAQCLEKDLAAQGPTVEEAKSRFMRTLTARIKDDLADGRIPLSTLGQAPQTYFDDLGYVRTEGPELPVYVPTSPIHGKKSKATQPKPPFALSARFLKAA